MSIPANILIGTVGTLLTFACGFAAQVVIFRFLGKAGGGAYFLIVAANAFFASVASLGIGLGNTVFLSRRENSLGELNAASLLFTAALSIIFGAVFWFLFVRWQAVASVVLHGLEVRYVWAGILALPFILYTMCWASLMVGLNRIYDMQKLLVVTTAGKSMVDIGIVLSGGAVRELLVWFVIWAALSSLAMFLWTLRLENARLHLKISVLKKLLSFGIRGYVGRLASAVWLRLDQFWLNSLHGQAAVGLYVPAVSLTEKLWTFNKPVSNALMPRVSSAEADEARELTSRLVRHLFFLLLCVSVALAVASRWIFELYGPQALDRQALLIILLPGTIGVGLSMVISAYVIGQLKRPGLLSILAWVNAAVNIGLCYLLLPRLGVYGAAIASSFTYFFGTVVNLTLLKFWFGFKLRDVLVIRRSDFADYRRAARYVLGKLRRETEAAAMTAEQ